MPLFGFTTPNRGDATDADRDEPLRSMGRTCRLGGMKDEFCKNQRKAFVAHRTSGAFWTALNGVIGCEAPNQTAQETVPGRQLERRATTKNNENQSVCDRFPIVYLLYWNFLPRLGKLLNTRWNFELGDGDARFWSAHGTEKLRFPPQEAYGE
jgi:hypothetical protein